MDGKIVAPYMLPMFPHATGVQPGGGLVLPIHWLICDVYGTLFISAAGDNKAASDRCLQRERKVADILERYNFSITPNQLNERLRTAIDERHRLARSRGNDFPEVDIERIWRSILPTNDQNAICNFAVEYELIVNPVWPMPGLQSLLATCARLRIRLGIVSNAQFYTPLLFKWFLGKDPTALGFEPNLTIYSFEYGIAKPSPVLFQTAVRRLERMGGHASRAAFMGNDMRNDIAASRQAGFQTILFAGDARSLRERKQDPDCKTVVPDLVITELAQLEYYLH